MPEYYQMTINGVPFRRKMTKKEAEELCEEWQGHRATYGGHQRGGLLKHKDFGDWVEMKRDPQAEKEFDESYRRYKNKELQTVTLITTTFP